MINARLTVRKLLGYSLLAICALAWAAVVVVPFLDVGLGGAAAIITGLIIVGEGAFVIGVALLGKEILNSIKALVGRLKDELRK